MKQKKQIAKQKNTKFSEEAAAVLATLHPIFAEVSGVSAEEMELDNELAEDLSVDMTKDIRTIIGMVNKEFSIDLDLMTVLDEVVTLGDLVTLIIEEKALLS